MKDEGDYGFLEILEKKLMEQTALKI